MENDNYMSYRVRVSGPHIATVSLRSPLDFPHVNDHVLIAGSSGSGKSFFASHLFPKTDGLILFKPDPEFKRVPLVSKYGLPDLSHFKIPDIADAYLYSLGLDITGIMASSLVPLLMNGLSTSGLDVYKLQNFLFNYMSGSDKMMSGIASLLHSHFEVLSSLFQGNKKFSHSKKLNLSFAGLGTFKAEFGAELLLRDYYSRIGRSLGSLMIDEFHHVSRSGSIIDILLREMRLSGRLIAITQNLTDLSPAMINNFGTILLGRSVNSDDMKFLSYFGNSKRYSSELPIIVSSLPKFCFLNFTEYLVSRDPVPIYRWYNDIN
jgi:hypothetical protein